MKNFYLILGLFSALLITSCNKEEDTLPTSNVMVITEDTFWNADSIYQLSGRVTVTNGATLTIEPGTIIKGKPGSGANASALVIARGAKLIAEGTEDAPIIFTSTADNISIEDIEAGVFSSPNLNPTINGLWGGVIILGNAPISASNDVGDVSQVQIEGIPTSDPNGLYGGDNPTDNSGVLRYVSIRHGGANIGSGNEINGLTLGGVGSGTVIDNIEIVANQDDGIEFFGGAVNAAGLATQPTTSNSGTLVVPLPTFSGREPLYSTTGSLPTLAPACACTCFHKASKPMLEPAPLALNSATPIALNLACSSPNTFRALVAI